MYAERGHVSVILRYGSPLFTTCSFINVMRSRST